MTDQDRAFSRQNSGENPADWPDDDEVSPPHQPIWQTVRLLLLRVIALLAAFIFLALLLTGFAGWYTSRPQFCNSCHIMEPYYTSWQTSSHSGVSCIKCHFPPGVGEKVRGKMLGLVQLAKYVTASEGPRPAAEIPDASCLRSGCHETRLLSGRVDFHGIPFDHQPHLQQLRRGKRLRCTSCHSQIVQGAHMTVTTSTCFLCHFKGGLFNEGVGVCTRCHQIPEEEFDLGGGVTFHHDLAYEKGVDCANCHGDLIQGDGEVPYERCGVCHNRQEDLEVLNREDKDFFLHKIHVTDHKVDCLACHLEIRHSLDPRKILHAAADCTRCHPDHHREQREMLLGIGGRSIRAQPSSMIAARAACPTCHRVKDVSPTETVLMKASLQTCTECHEADEVARLETYHQQMREAVSKLHSGFEPIRAALQSAELAADRKESLEKQLQDLQYDVDFLRVGNDIHNSHYARALASAVIEKLTSICHELKIEPPDVRLAESPLASRDGSD